ncbi:MAG: hypothetical protein ACTSQ8_02775 [Candidatus Helarchaeota archaeon]
MCFHHWIICRCTTRGNRPIAGIRIPLLHFLIKSTKGITSNEFLIQNLPGSSGRLDIVLRCILAAFTFGTQGIYIHSILNGPPSPPKAIHFTGEQLHELPIDEIEMAKLFREILDPTNPIQKAGISITADSFLDTAANLGKIGTLFLLKEDAPLFNYHFVEEKKGTTTSFILSDHLNLEAAEENYLINELGATPINLGPKSYLASHCIIFLLMELQNYRKNKRGIMLD